MQQNTFLRAHTGTVVLGLPSSPARYLFGLYRKTGNRPVIVAHRFPLWLFCFPFTKLLRSTTPRFSDILVMELSDFANRYEDKRMRLIPITEQARLFVEENQSALEASYIIEWTPTE